MDAADQPVLAERRGRVLLLTLNRPERMNGWSDPLEERYFQLLDDAEADPEVRAVVVTGTGRAFCVGVDFGDVDEELDPEAAARKATERPRPRSRPWTFRKPLIAAINGSTAGLGLIETLYCDVRFCVPDAKLTT